MTKRVYVETLGCQMNKLDSELVLGALAEAGFEPCGNPDDAEVVLINTCSVRQRAEDKVYSRLGALRKRKERRPALIVGVLGCMAQKEGRALVDRMPHVDLVCGTRMIHHVPRLLREIESGAEQIVAVEDDGVVHFDRHVGQRPIPHAAYVAVMRGCNNFCSYCIVPYVRGREISRPVADIVAEVGRLAADVGRLAGDVGRPAGDVGRPAGDVGRPAGDGCKEVTLLGQNVNSYGRGLDRQTDLADLLEAAASVGGIQRIRFVTSHPKDMSDRILDAVARIEEVCEHLHVPAQSGADAVLQRMKRGYSAADYDDLIRRARERIPGVTFSSDFIVGFPGETEADFQATLSLVRRAEFQNCFIFKYSPRPRTAAADLADDVPDEVKRERNQILLKAQEEVAARRNRAMHGEVVEVMADGPSKKDASRLSTRTRQNHIVVFPGAASLAGRLVRVRITDSTPLTLFGEIEHAR